MNFRFVLLLPSTALLLLAGSCSKKSTQAIQTACETPWLPGRIAEAQRTDRGIDSVVEYRFKGTTVYVFNLGAVADGESPVYRCDGTQLCQLGGFAGNRMCDGSVFTDEATAPKTVWRKLR